MKIGFLINHSEKFISSLYTCDDMHGTEDLKNLWQEKSKNNEIPPNVNLISYDGDEDDEDYEKKMKSIEKQYFHYSRTDIYKKEHIMSMLPQVLNTKTFSNELESIIRKYKGLVSLDLIDSLKDTIILADILDSGYICP